VGTQTIVIDGDSVRINSGYLVGNSDGAVRYILNLSHVGNSRNNCPHDWCGCGNARTLPGGYTTTLGRGVKVTPQTYDHNDLCGVNYMIYYDGTKPDIAVISSGC